MSGSAPMQHSYLLQNNANALELRSDDSLAPASAAKPQPLLHQRWVRWALLAVVTVVIVVVVAVVLTRSRSSSGWTDSMDTPDGELSYMVQSQPKYMHNLTLPVRLQWNANYGYCGSTSMIMAGMYYGAYVSQFDNRYIASNNTQQSKQGSQMLLGVNDYWTAHQHKLTNELWNYNDLNVKHFLTWIKSQVLQDRVVIMGIFENGYIFDFKGGDADYDHIVPVTGWGSSHSLDDLSYYDDDVIYFSDNGLYTPSAGGNGEDISVFHISATMKEVAKSRTDANKKAAGVYSINSAPTKANPNYAIAITGIVDEHNDCLPTSLVSDKNYELPEMKEGSDKRPTPMSQTITATARELTVGEDYNMYMYSSFEDVPSTGFNAAKDQAAHTWAFTATSTTWSTSQTVRTDEMAIFRTVPTSAP